MLGEAHLGLGEFTLAKDELKKGLSILGRPWPNRVTLATLSETFKQFRFRYGLIRAVADLELDLEESKIVEYLGHVFYFNEENEANVLSNLRGLNRLELLGPSSALASSYAQVGVILGIIGLSGLAEKYMARGSSVLPEDAGAADRMMFANYAALYALAKGSWNDGETHSQEMYEQSHLIGDQRMMCYSISIMSISCSCGARRNAVRNCAKN